MITRFFLLTALFNVISGLNFPSSHELTPRSMDMARSAMDYITKSPSPNHAVEQGVNMLIKADFVKLDERKPWPPLKNGGKYYFQREHTLGSSLVAFTIGHHYSSSSRFKIIGAHTDSPNLRIKPKSRRTHSSLTLLNVETYGGGLWHTWFDRDLSLAGKVILKNPSGIITQRLVNLKKPILRIPNLAIHLQTGPEKEAFKVNKEDHLQPVLSGYIEKVLGGNETSSWQKGHEPKLLRTLASELGVEISEIVDFELHLYDTLGASFNGLDGEFITSSRLDNQMGCYVSLQALLNHADKGLKNDSDVSLIALFDHEEVGSSSTTGAGSTLIEESVKRISGAMREEEDGQDLLECQIRKSFVVSFDMAHAEHPNYSTKHEKFHAPKLNSGVVIKTNDNQRYATSGQTGYIFREIGRKIGHDVQEFVVRNDCACGSTIGPIISARTGMRCVDVGTAQLSMHSIREMGGTKDVEMAVDLLEAFFERFREIDEELNGE
ncbi:hypothetical protein TL16_g06141 [Triparma laevis f. inornata]|uniref:aspartyl aminopeptidase n=1 Tax=Triparma laevis f. inornata TaxID=1714386 RepID=A0A9W7EBX3_9STRA|nr:hypothetical protein TL16_g06141 [Triparma laevis f. inornata]